MKNKSTNMSHSSFDNNKKGTRVEVLLFCLLIITNLASSVYYSSLESSTA